jgi:hypothetical protein
MVEFPFSIKPPHAVSLRGRGTAGSDYLPGGCDRLLLLHPQRLQPAKVVGQCVKPNSANRAIIRKQFPKLRIHAGRISVAQNASVNARDKGQKY